MAVPVVGCVWRGLGAGKLQKDSEAVIASSTYPHHAAGGLCVSEVVNEQ